MNILALRHHNTGWQWLLGRHGLMRRVHKMNPTRAIRRRNSIRMIRAELAELAHYSATLLGYISFLVTASNSSTTVNAVIVASTSLSVRASTAVNVNSATISTSNSTTIQVNVIIQGTVCAVGIGQAVRFACSNSWHYAHGLVQDSYGIYREPVVGNTRGPPGIACADIPYWRCPRI